MRLNDDSPVNSAIMTLMPTGYYHPHCWHASKWFELEEVTGG
jgi:hypothetical protein